MALNDNSFSIKLQALYSEMTENPMSMQDYADKMAKLLDDQTKTAEVPPGRVIVQVTGDAVGTPNPAGISVV